MNTTEYAPKHSRNDIAETEEFQKYIESQNHDKWTGIHRDEASIFKADATLAFVISLVGLIIGWALFGVPSMVSLVLATRVLKKGPSVLAKWAQGLSVLGVFMGLIAFVAVVTQ